MHTPTRNTLTKLIITLFLFCVPFGYVQYGGEWGIPFAPAIASASDDTWESFVGEPLLNLGAYVAYLGGNVFDWAFFELVFKMGEDFNYTGSGSVDGYGALIEKIWTLVRDFCNIVFIFGLIYVGIRTILDSERAETRRFLITIITAALLINFSLFFTKFIVEVPNRAAVTFYQNFALKDPDAGTTGAGLGYSIALPFIDAMRLSSYYGLKAPSVASLSASATAPTTGGAGGDPDLGKVDSFTFFLGGMILFLVIGAVFLASGILLISRYITILVILMGSPLIFAAYIFPQTQDYAKKMLMTLIKNSIFVFVYLFALYVILQILTEAFQDERGNFADALTGGGDATPILLTYIFGIMLLLAALKMAQSFGIKGAETVSKTTQSILRKGGGMVAGGGAAFLGRRSLGRAAESFANSKWLLDRSANSKFARGVLSTTRAVGDSSFDVRNIKGVGEKIGVGSGRKGGYKSIQDETEAKRKKFADSLGEIDDSDPQVRARKDSARVAKDTLQREKSRLQEDLKSDDENTRNRALQKLTALEKEAENAEQLYQQEKKRRVLGTTFTNADDQPIVAGTNRVNGFIRQRTKLQERKDEVEKQITDLSTLPPTPVRDQEIQKLQNESATIVSELTRVETDLNAAESALSNAQASFNKSAFGLLQNSFNNSTQSLNAKYTEYLNEYRSNGPNVSKLKEEYDALLKVHTKNEENLNEYKQKQSGGYASALENTSVFARLSGEAYEIERGAGASIRKAYMKNIKKSENERQTDAVVSAVKGISK